MVFLHFVLACAGSGAGCVGGEVFDDGEGGHGVNLLLVHHAHGFGREEVGVVDAGDAGFDGEASAGLAGAVHADAATGALSFGDGGGEFGFGVLVGRGESLPRRGGRGRSRRSW